MDDAGHCVGAVTRNIRDGEMQLFRAKSVILASGGNGQIWQPTTNALICTGDGIAMAYRAGAKLMDMEMIQYHPTTLAGKGFLITEGARGEGAHLLNARGERFMERYAPNKMELASRDVVSRAEQTEINEGRGFPDGTVALDITVVPRKRIHEALREIVLVGRDFAGVDITREPIHIKPGNHYTMGGVKTDIWGRTNVAGLYAAGEVACVSVHGGNRLGANSLLDTLIFGRRSGEDAAVHARGRGFDHVARGVLGDEEARIRSIVSREHTGRRVSQIKAELGATMDGKVAVFRDEEGIAAAPGKRCAELKEEAKGAWIDDRGTIFNQDVLGALELENMLDCAETTCMAALERRESRGGSVPHRLPRAQRRRMAQAHRRLDERRGPRDRLLTGDDHRLATAGEDLLDRWPPTRSRFAATSPSPRTPTAVAPSGRASTSSSTRRSRSSTGCCRRARQGRHARGPLLLPRRDLRLLRGQGQRQSTLACKTQIGEAAADAERTARGPTSPSSRWATCP